MPEVQVISEQTKLENHASYQVQVGELTYGVALTRACDSWTGAWYWVAGIYRWEGIRQIPSHPG